MSYQSGMIHKKSNCVQSCGICEDKINIGDDIVWCQPRRVWEHLTCPWRNDDGYRPDMVVIDIDNADRDYFTIKEHIKNQERDRQKQCESLEEQESGAETYEMSQDNSDSWHERLWIRIQELFGY